MGYGYNKSPKILLSTSGCEATSTTIAVTPSTDSSYACPEVISGQPLAPDYDVFGGCQPGFFHYLHKDYFNNYSVIF